MANTSRYRYIKFYGGRILQAREVAELQRIQEGLNPDGSGKTSFDLNAVYAEGATFNITPSIINGVVTLNKTNTSDYMYVFVRGRWEVLQPSEISNSLTVPSGGGSIYLNWVLRQVTSTEDGTLIDVNTGEPTADMGELDLSVSTSDTSGVSIAASQFEKNTSPVVLFTYNSAMQLVKVDNVNSRAIASTKNSGLVSLTTDTSGIAVATDDARLLGIGSVSDGAVTDVKVRTPSASGGSNPDGTPVYSLLADPGGISSSKLIHLPGSQLVSDAIEWIKARLNSIASTFNNHIGARLGSSTTHPMPTAADVNAAPLSHVSLSLGVAGSHPPNVSADSGGWRLDRNAVPANANDPGFGLFQAGTLINGFLHDGDTYCNAANNIQAHPVGTPTSGPLGKLSILAAVLAEHVNQTNHANPHGLSASDLGAATTSYVDSSSANVLVSANNYTDTRINGIVTGNLTQKGYLRLSNGLIFQWTEGSQDSATAVTNQTVNFPMVFPTACLAVFPSTRWVGGNNDDISSYQLTGYNNAQAQLRRVRGGSYEQAQITVPIVWAIGF